MRVLIVESRQDLAAVWQRHLERLGLQVLQAQTGDQATAIIGEVSEDLDVILIDLDLTVGSPIGVADYARMRRPLTNVIFVSDTTFFSDGSLFALSSNARAHLKTGTAPEDLAAIVEHYAIRHDLTVPPMRLPVV